MRDYNRKVRAFECENFFSEFKERLLRLIENIDLLDSANKKIRKRSRAIIEQLLTAMEEADPFLVDQCATYFLDDYDNHLPNIRTEYERGKFSLAKDSAKTLHRLILSEKIQPLAEVMPFNPKDFASKRRSQLLRKR